MNSLPSISITIVVNIQLPEWVGHRKITLNSILVDQTWQKVIFENFGIRDNYLLKGGTYHAELHENIRIYYEKFQKQMRKYLISIVPLPKTPQSPSISVPQLPRNSTKRTKIKTETTKNLKMISIVPRPTTPPSPSISIQQLPISSTKGTKRKTETTSKNLKMISIVQRPTTPPPPSPSISIQQLPISSTKGTKRKTETTSKFDPKAVRYFNQTTEELRSEVLPILPRGNDLKFRTEDTMTGNLLPNGKDKSVAFDIRNFLVNRISNTDILQVRLELLELKRQGKYMALNRMASFTAGFLENAFLRNSY